MKRSLLFRMLGFALGTLGTALLLELALRVLPVADATLGLPVNESNPVPRLQPNREFRFSKGWNFALSTLKRSNNYGFLSDYDYARRGPRPLLALIGDSYIEAMQVRNAESVTARLAAIVGDSGRVYGLGASGAALPTYLAYAAFAAREFSPDALVFSIVGNDFDESLLAYYPQPRNHYFVPGPDGALALWRFDYSPSPLKRLGRQSALIRYLLLNCQPTTQGLRAVFNTDRTFVANTSSSVDPQRVADSRRAVDAFFRLLPENAELPASHIAFLLDGMRPSLYSSEGMEAARGSYAEYMRDYFSGVARGLGYEVIDLQLAFEQRHRESGERFEFPTDNHWNASGHRVATEMLCRSTLFVSLFPSIGGSACPVGSSVPRADSGHRPR